MFLTSWLTRSHGQTRGARRRSDRARRVSRPGAILSVEQLEDRTVPVPIVMINNVTVTEGHSGTVNVDFLLTLTEPPGPAGASVQWTTVNGTALAGSDYQARSGIAFFPFAPPP